jgi:ABC-type dipeptide/oligopeptide/nickel transport system permease subunit
MNKPFIGAIALFFAIIIAIICGAASSVLKVWWDGILKK